MKPKNKSCMDRVNKISPTMCLAKWMQSTILLQNGHTHSCHHPVPHKIPLDELANSPSALHNTLHKKHARQDLLDGIQTSECDYCWNIENLDKGHVSDRVYKSIEDWSNPFIDKIIENGAGGDIHPSYLEVSFDHTCNLKCAYCSPDISSKWMEEIRQSGAYELSDRPHNSIQLLKQAGRFPYLAKEQNPYVDAFWEWWPELYQGLSVFRITGGEPLLSKNTWRVLEYIEANPRKDLSLAINTNLDVPQHLIDRLIDSVNRIQPLIKSFEIYTSCEATGEQAEYIRYGLDYDRFTQNIHKVLSQSDCRVNMMIAFNVLSLTTFDAFLADIIALRDQYNIEGDPNRIPMMISYVRFPRFLDMRIAPYSIKRHFADRIHQYTLDNMHIAGGPTTSCFFNVEMEQIERLVAFMLETPSDLEKQLLDFTMFIDQYDDRRGSNFMTTFPELASML